MNDPKNVVVVGGGFAGTTVARALERTLPADHRVVLVSEESYATFNPLLKVTLLQDADRLLPELPVSLGDAAARSLAASGVEVRLQQRAAQVHADGVSLTGGASILGATVICTIGTRPNPLAEQLSLPKQRGRIAVATDLSVPGARGVWAIGDCALVPNAAGGLCPPTAQFAVAQAKALAHNIVAAIAGRPTRAFSHRSRGTMAITGHLQGVAQLFGVRLAGLPAWLLRRAYYLLLMPTLGRKLRIGLEWTWGMFFPADITHLRFTRTREADAEPAEEPQAVVSISR